MEWLVSQELVEYRPAEETMEARVRAIREEGAQELVWLLEHPPLYTAGTSANAADLLPGARFPVHETGRGGQYTYHGPGQRVAYVLMDLKKQFAPQEPDLREYVKLLERWMIETLSAFGVAAFIREGRVGVWVETPSGEAKIGAIGVRVQKWVSYHGIALNVQPDLSHFAGIVPCGIREFGVTSLHALGKRVSMAAVDAQLRARFRDVFGRN